MANEVTSTTTVYDNEKFLAAKLLQRAHLKLVAASVCDKVMQPKGSGLTFNFVRYTRMNVPVVTLTQGTPPSNSAFPSLETVTGTLDQWGDYIKITDVAQLTTKHPLVQIATDLLSDNAQRVIDREVQIVMIAGTNVQYGDGSVTTRATITTSLTVTDKSLHKARITMENNGAPPRSGPSNMKENAMGGPLSGTLRAGNHYVAICGPELAADVQGMAAATNMWVNVTQYQDKTASYNGEIGTYLGFRFVGTNFIPKFTRLGSVTAAVASTATDGVTVTAINSPSGGTLKSSTTFFWKVTRKDKTRGFEEAISIAHSTATAATGDDEAFDFLTPATAGYLYNLYFDAVVDGGTGTDATLGLVTANIEPATTTRVLTEATSTTTPPANNNTTGPVTSVYPMFIIAEQALAWIGLQDLKTMVTGNEPDKSDPLGQFTTMGYKFMAKAAILDQNRLLRVEFASNY